MKSFRQYLIPSISAQVFLSCYTIVDGIFIGYRTNDLGLAAINIAWPITAFIQGVGFAIGISAGMYISRLKGLGEEEKITKLKSAILVYLLGTSIVLGILIFILKTPILILFKAEGETLDAANRYITIILYGSIFQLMGWGMAPLIKNSGHVRTAMVASLLATLTKLILDYLLIFLFEFGLEGAAIATVIAQTVSFLKCFIPYVREMKGILFDKESIKEIFLRMLAPFILNYSYSIIIILTNALCEPYSGDRAVAA
jgi:Na+-driven multidrug efflux pump